jgi:hypothetical protein
VVTVEILLPNNLGFLMNSAGSAAAGGAMDAAEKNTMAAMPAIFIASSLFELTSNLIWIPADGRCPHGYIAPSPRFYQG